MTYFIAGYVVGALFGLGFMLGRHEIDKKQKQAYDEGFRDALESLR